MIKNKKLIAMIVLLGLFICFYSEICLAIEVDSIDINNIDISGWVAYESIEYSRLLLIEVFVFIQICITLSLIILSFTVYKKHTKKKILFIIVAIVIFVGLGYISYETLHLSIHPVSSDIDSPPSNIYIFLPDKGKVYIID